MNENKIYFKHLNFKTVLSKVDSYIQYYDKIGNKYTRYISGNTIENYVDKSSLIGNLNSACDKYIKELEIEFLSNVLSKTEIEKMTFNLANQNCELALNPFTTNHGKNYWVFWALMMIYGKSPTEILNQSILGLAKSIGFTEHMIRDWCRAIEYVLSGNHLSEDCDLMCESEEGKAFFLHK